MTKYQIPSKYHYRIHHVRPRFKNNVEEVLLYVSTNLSQIKPETKSEFDKKFDNALRMFPGNATKSKKTIANWRTEISSLFGFLVELKNGTAYAGDNAIMLSERQDLVEFFKYFLYTFQYPGGHMKPHETAKMIEKGIRFKPVSYILDLLRTAEKKKRKRFGINKAETTHCVFNDLRVTTGKRDVKDVISLIDDNRTNDLDYEWGGDVVRYAGDILDYMVYANLLERHGSTYYLNKTEGQAVDFFINHAIWYDGFDGLFNRKFHLSEVKPVSNLWFLYVNSYAGKVRFETDLMEYIGIDKSLYEKLASKSQPNISTAVKGALPQLLATSKGKTPKTKTIGDAGESLVHGHECTVLKNSKRNDLIPKVVILPNHLAMGFDIRSFDPKDNIKHIEVKTTISYSSLTFNQFHLTENEWNIAISLGDKYFVYRLQINRKENGEAEVRLFVIKNPIEKYKKGKIEVKSRNGMEVTFKPNAGSFEELLIWKN